VTTDATPAELLPAARVAGGLLPVDEQGALLDALDVAAERYLGQRGRPNTIRAYRDDWRVWSLFCAYLGVHPDTARLGLMVAFVEWLIRQQAAPTTIDRRLSGVAVTLAEHGVDVPRRITRAARKALSAYRHELAETGINRGRGQAVPVRVPHLRTICGYLDDVIADPTTSTRERLLALRDKALLLIGFGIAARRSELAGLHAADVQPSDDGVLITIRASKSSDQAAAVPVLAGTVRSTCPLRAWLAWDRAVREHLPERRRAFVDLHGRAAGLRWLPELSGHDVNTIIGRIDTAAGLNLGLTGHSLRAGLATEARRAGHDVTTIAAQGRWSPRSTEPYRYMRIVDQWADNATAGIGL
jgi:integrase